MNNLFLSTKVIRFITIVIFCGLLSLTLFAGNSISSVKQFSPEIPKFKGCCAKRIRSKPRNNSKKDIPIRIISLSPAVTEIIYALGAGDKIVAVSDFCNYPPEVKNKPVVGGFVNPSYERILTLHPDIIIYQGLFLKIKTFCKKYKIKSCNVQLDNWRTITNSIRIIGQKIGRSNAAKRLINKMAKKLNTIKKTKNKAVSVFVCVGREPGTVASCTTIGKDTFINEMLTIAGGSNIFDDVKGSYPTVSSEIISARQPKIIFEIKPNEKIDENKLKKDWRFFKNSKIIFITNDFAMIPGPRILKLAEKFKTIIQSNYAQVRQQNHRTYK